MTFEEYLRYGQTGETVIAKWLNLRGASVLPVYDVPENCGKGPRVFAPDGRVIAPDMLAFDARKACWIEAKTKSNFTWHRATQRWTTGIDLPHYEDYLRLLNISPWPVMLLFLHRNADGAKDTPTEMRGKSPTGLFYGNLEHLSRKVNHQHPNFGRRGGVFWAHDDLCQIAALEEIEALENGIAGFLQPVCT